MGHVFRDKAQGTREQERGKGRKGRQRGKVETSGTRGKMVKGEKVKKEKHVQTWTHGTGKGNKEDELGVKGDRGEKKGNRR